MLVANDRLGMGAQDEAPMKCVDVYPERDERLGDFPYIPPPFSWFTTFLDGAKHRAD